MIGLCEQCNQPILWSQFNGCGMSHPKTIVQVVKSHTIKESNVKATMMAVESHSDA